MSTDLVLSEVRDGVLILTLNRPDKLNSFVAEMNEALIAGVRRAASDAEIRAVLLTGTGRAFSAGQDLSATDAVGDGDDLDLGKTIEEHFNPLIRAIRALAKPVVCAVNGIAAGAAANLAFACDIVLAARSASFLQAFCKIGLIPDAGGTYLLPRLVGEARAKGLAMLGDQIPAEQALDWGLIWKVSDDEALMEDAFAIAAGLAKGPTAGYGLMKQAIQSAWSNSIDDHLDLERDLQRKAGKSPDFKEGVAAFFERRAPNFTGRTGDE